MKKLVSLLLLISMFSVNAAFCTDTQSQNAIEIPITTVPPGGSDPLPRSGLSNGAVTAIVLGSTFGGLAALGGAAYYFAKSGLMLKAGQVLGQGCPTETISIQDGKFLEKLQLNCPKYKHLITAIEKNHITGPNGSRYLVIQDMGIQNKTYNTIYFNLPKPLNGKALNVKITQISDVYTMNGKKPALDTKILLSTDEKNPKEIPLYVSQIEPNKGILEKRGQITDFSNNTAVLTTSFNDTDKDAQNLMYAVLVEFQ